MGIARGLLSCRRTIRRGTTAVEFAFVVPLMVAIVLACVDLGRFAYNYIAVTNAARAGAAYGIMNPYSSSSLTTWTTAVKQAAKDEMAQQPGYDSTKLNVTVTTATETNGLRRVRVSASYPFQTVVNWPGIPNQLTLDGVVEMRSIR